LIRERALPSGIAVIGATGSVGGAVVDVCRRFPERFRIAAMAGLKNVAGMARLAAEFNPGTIAMVDEQSAVELKSIVPRTIKILSGTESLREIALSPEASQVVFASSGTEAIPALMETLSHCKPVSLANKESLVIAGSWVMPLVKDKSHLRPLDSEHNAVWQCLLGETERSVRSITLTASGGPFRNLGLEELRAVTPLMALKHPVWPMGAKITVDSATLMNKGLEILEAMQLFNLPAEKVQAVVHPQSLVHGMVHFSDCTTKWLLSRPDMRIPAAVALAYPDRLDLREETLDFPSLGDLALSFEEPDLRRFPCLRLAMEAAERGGAAPALLVGADEIAVEAFLNEKLPLTGIPALIERTVDSYPGPDPRSAEEAIDIANWARQKAQKILNL